MDTSPRQHGYNLFKYVTKEKKDVTNIYFYAILNGLVQLSVPLGIQSIVSFVMGATMATSIYMLIAFVVLGTWLVGYFRLKVMQIIEKIQQKIFVEFSLAFAEKLPKVNLSATRKYYLPELVNRFFDTQNLQKGISKILLEIPTALIQILFGILLLSFYHPWFLVFEHWSSFASFSSSDLQWKAASNPASMKATRSMMSHLGLKILRLLLKLLSSILKPKFTLRKLTKESLNILTKELHIFECLLFNTKLLLLSKSLLLW